MSVFTDKTVQNLKTVGRYTDPTTSGLNLQVKKGGKQYWTFRFLLDGKRHDIGLGVYPTISLKEARQRATSVRNDLNHGRMPQTPWKPVKATIKASDGVCLVTKPTFSEFATSCISNKRAEWRNAKHAAQWINTLTEYVFPLIGSRPVDQIDTPDLLRVLTPIWLKKPETARRVRQRISTVLDWAKAAGHRSGDNPVAGVAKGLPKQSDRTSHLAALPYATVPAFVDQLRASDFTEMVRLAFEFLVLTAARTSEVLEAKWTEIDLKGAIWTIPASRMKAGREHRVPLAPACIIILKRARELAPEADYVFTGRSSEKPLSNMVFLMALRRLKLDVTAHGFRSAFRDWASERTNFPNEVCELALAHTNKNKVEAAYQHSDLLEKRRELMATWAAFVTSSKGKVVSLRA